MSFLGTEYFISIANTSLSFVVLIVGGKHVYSLRQYFLDTKAHNETSTFPEKDSYNLVAHVRTPSNCAEYGVQSGYGTLGISWRDAVRVAAHRHSLKLCMCGEFNSSSSYTVVEPNEELPTILPGNECLCDSPLQGPFDMWIPCNFLEEEPQQLLQGTDCAKQVDLQQHSHQTRVFLLHSTTYVDRLTLKNKLWQSLKQYYGVERAALIMPRAYNLEDDPEDLASFQKACSDIVNNRMGRYLIFIMKNAYQHQQKGISLSSAQQLIDSGIFKGGGIADGYSMATQFLPRPFLVEGYKINMRRYVVAVCIGGRLRGYVHDDGKNIYTKRKYREPWDGEEWENSRYAFNRRLEELITTGYVDESHYDDKPLSGLEFFEYVREQRKVDPTTFQLSMWCRLAFALHMSINSGEFKLCETDPEITKTGAIPSCLQDAIRFQHFGCDFHVDSALTGYESRFFECNKGPDFALHSYRDGKMKREVAEDILAFVGFKGDFDGSPENARKHRLNLIYDSETFNAERAFQFLDSLSVVDPRLRQRQVRWNDAEPVLENAERDEL